MMKLEWKKFRVRMCWTGPNAKVSACSDSEDKDPSHPDQWKESNCKRYFARNFMQ